MWARARAAGVRGALVPGVEAAGSARLAALCAAHGWRYAVGTHPHALVRTREVPREPGGAAAIGECGLDRGVPVPMAEQEAVLDAHLALARDTGLPVVLHCWRAHDVLLARLRRFGRVSGVLHSYSGGPELVAPYVAAGLHLGFGGAITRPGARKPVEALQRVPRDRLLAETDAPDQPPHPRRGRNEPAFLVEIVRAMEAHRGEPLAAALTENAAGLFGFPTDAPPGPAPAPAAAPR